jgi:hypothetical protein
MQHREHALILLHQHSLCDLEFESLRWKTGFTGGSLLTWQASSIAAPQPARMSVHTGRRRGEGHGIAFCKTTPCKVGRAASPETPSSAAAGCSSWPAAPCRRSLSVTARRWTKKHGKSFYFYKNHMNADAKHKLIRRYEVTDASVHDSRKFDGLLNQANTSATCAACAAAFINARAAIIRYRRRSRMRTAKRAKFGLVARVRRSPRRVAGSCG